MTIEKYGVRPEDICATPVVDHPPEPEDTLKVGSESEKLQKAFSGKKSDKGTDR